MIGNDVIDLKLAATSNNWQRHRYLEKIFSAHERSTVLSASIPGARVWLLWSLKEAAYKIVNRATGLRALNPLAFTCSVSIEGDQAIGEVHYKNQRFITQSYVGEQYLHTLAVTRKAHLDTVEVLVEPWPEQGFINPEGRKNWESRHQFAKNQSGFPIRTWHCGKDSTMASLSHHGRFVGLVTFRF